MASSGDSDRLESLEKLFGILPPGVTADDARRARFESRGYPMGPVEREAIAELREQIDAGTARTYGSFAELLAEVDGELARGDDG